MWRGPLGSASEHTFAGSLLESLWTDDLGEGGILNVAFLGLTAHCVSNQARAPLWGRELEAIVISLAPPKGLFKLSLPPT